MNSHLEKLVTALVFTGIFLPVRLVFYNLVSHWWFGSFGLMTVILLSLFYLANKGKLGWFGRIILKQMGRFSAGKVGLFFIINLGFMAYFFGNVIYGIETASIDTVNVMNDELQKQGVTDMKTLQQHMPEAQITPTAALISILYLILPNTIGHSVLSIMNDLSHGWILHFSTVIFMEQLEMFGLLIYFRKRSTILKN